MNKMLKRGLLLGLLLLIISGLTIYFTIDLKALRTLETFNFTSLILALVALAVGMYFDGLRLQRLVQMGGYKLPIKAVLRVIFGNYFMAMLTPGASGGAVAQVLILKSYGVPVMKGADCTDSNCIFYFVFNCYVTGYIFTRLHNNSLHQQYSLDSNICTYDNLYNRRLIYVANSFNEKIGLHAGGTP